MSGPVTFGAELLRIAPADIHIPARLGLFFPDKAAALGRLMAIHGQRTPITVRKSAGKVAEPWTLVVGMHRLNGARLEELPQVFALERIGGTAADALDEEASENLDRRDQPPLERAIFIHATCEAAKARLSPGDFDQRQLAAKARWEKVKNNEIRAEQALAREVEDASDMMSLAYGWIDSVAEAFGRDKRTIHRALTLYRMLIEPFPEFTQALSDHPVVGNNAAQLKEIAVLPGENQRRAVIELLLASPSLSADEARVAAGIPQDTKGLTHRYDKFAAQISTGWQRMSLPQRRDFVPRIVEMMHTPELKRELRDRLNAELGDNGPEASGLKPAVPIRQSVKADYIVCLEDGTRHTNLTRWLNKIGMTPGEYRARWDLPCDYPMLAPNYSVGRVDAWRKRVRAARAKAAKAAAA